MVREIDIETLRKDLLDYFGTAMLNVSPLAILELSKIERADDEQIIQLAINNNFDLNQYTYKGKRR